MMSDSDDRLPQAISHARSHEEHEGGERNLEELTAIVVDTAYHLHVDLGPGLLESVYEAVMAKLLRERGLKVERQKSVMFEYHDMIFDEGLRIDLLVNDRLVVELKSVEAFAPVHAKQVLTYLRLLHLPIGLLINFGSASFKEGCKRIVNNHQDFASSRLRVNQGENLARSREEHEA
jgi:iron complex transport system substrate-binding protein